MNELKNKCDRLLNEMTDQDSKFFKLISQEINKREGDEDKLKQICEILEKMGKCPCNTTYTMLARL